MVAVRVISGYDACDPSLPHQRVSSMKTTKKRAFQKKDGTYTGPGSRKWSPEVIIDVYRYARLGLGDIKIGDRLKVTYTTFKIWRRSKPEVRKALETGRKDYEADKKRDAELERIRKEELKKMEEKELANRDSLKDFVLERLSPEVRQVWDRIDKAATAMTLDQEKENWEMTEKDKYHAIQKLNRFNRQHLFVYALINSDYSMTEAARRCGFSTSTLSLWLKEPGFRELMDEVQRHKYDFFETAFVKLVKMGDPKAIIHAAKTMLKNRGYGSEVKVSVGGTVKHDHDHKITKVSDLPLDLETKLKIRDSFRRTQKALPAHDSDGEVVEAEVVDD